MHDSIGHVKKKTIKWGGGIGAATPLRILKDFCHFFDFWYIGPFPGHHRSENTPELGQKHPMTQKFMIRATQNMIKCKKIVKKWLFDGFGHVG